MGVVERVRGRRRLPVKGLSGPVPIESSAVFSYCNTGAPLTLSTWFESRKYR